MPRKKFNWFVRYQGHRDEVQSFDKALDRVEQIAAAKNSFVATTRMDTRFFKKDQPGGITYQVTTHPDDQGRSKPLFDINIERELIHPREGTACQQS